MATILVEGAADRLLAQGSTEAPDRCLEHCWQAIGQGKHYLTGGGESAAATAAAVPVANRHYDTNVPKDMPVFLLRDVFISRGDGTFVATDWPSSQKIGICTLAQRLRQTGETFQFWADSMGGYTLIGPSKPIEEETDMPEQWYRIDSGKTTFALFDADHWEEYTDPDRANADAALYMRWNGFAAVNITGDASKLAAWNYRSNLSPDLKQPFGAPAPINLSAAQVKAIASAITVPPAPASGITKADLTAAVAVGTKAVKAAIPTKLTT